MPTKLKGVAYSLEEGAKYNVYIDDDAPSTESIPDIEVVNLTVSHQAATKDIDANLLLSNAEVTFRVQNATQEAVFASMADSEELRYKIRVEKDDALFYVGFVLLDLFTIDDDSGDYNIKIKATDGVGRLKSIDYDGGGLFYDDYETGINHIFNILSEIPLDDYYDASDEYLRINATLWPEGLTPDGSTDQLDLIRFSYRAFRTIDTKGEAKFSNCYDVLREICKAFGLRFMYSGGRYVLTDITDYSRDAGTVRFLRYNKAGTQIATQNLSGWGQWTRGSGELVDYADNTVSIVTRAGGKIVGLPALRQVNWSYKHYSSQNTLPTTPVWSNSASPLVTIQNFVTAPTLRIRLTAGVSFDVVPPDNFTPTGQPIHVVFGMRLQVTDDQGTKSVSRDYVINGTQVSYNSEAWVDGPAISYPFVFRGSIPDQEDAENDFYQYQIDMVTPVVPSSGTMTLQFFLIDVLIGGNIFAGASVNYTIDTPYMETRIGGSFAEQYNFSNFRSVNTAFTNNSKLLERDSVLGDGPTVNSFGRFEYYDGSEWLKTDEWRKYAGGSYQDATSALHGAIRAKDILALQEAPRQRLQGTLIIRDNAPEYLYLRAGKKYLPYKYAHDLLNDRVKGEWIQIAYAPASITYPTEAPTDTPIMGDAGGISADPSNGGTQTPPIVITPPDPPGMAAPGEIVVGTTNAPTGLGSEIAADEESNTIPLILAPSSLPLYAGDVVVMTNPQTGQQQEVTVLYNSELGILAEDQIAPPAPAFPYYTDAGIVWLTPSNTLVEVEAFTPTSTFPANSFVQFNAAYLARLRALLRTDHIDARIFGFSADLATGFTDWFWRTGTRIGWQIKRVHFAFAQDMGGSAKVNLKMYDGTGFRYTVATYDGGGLGGIIPATTDIIDGYLRVEVETITGTAPKGLTVTIEIIKIIQ